MCESEAPEYAQIVVESAPPRDDTKSAKQLEEEAKQKEREEK